MEWIKRAAVAALTGQASNSYSFTSHFLYYLSLRKQTPPIGNTPYIKVFSYIKTKEFVSPRCGAIRLTSPLTRLNKEFLKMKDTRKVSKVRTKLTAMLILFAITFVLASCGGGATPQSITYEDYVKGSTYRLTITHDTAKAAFVPA
jgi:hypothetical protein